MSDDKYKLLNLKYNFTEMCSLGSNWQYGSIDSENGLEPNRRRVIIWSNDSILDWCINVSPSLNVLSVCTIYSGVLLKQRDFIGSLFDNVVQYNMIFYTSLHWLEKNINEN